jgi:hypothetical protein
VFRIWVCVFRAKAFRLSLDMYIHDVLIFYSTSLHLQLPALFPAFYSFLSVCQKTREKRTLAHHFTQHDFVPIIPCEHEECFYILENSLRLIPSYLPKNKYNARFCVCVDFDSSKICNSYVIYCDKLCCSSELM